MPRDTYSHVMDVQPGAILPGSKQCIAGVQAADAKAPLELTLPGQILRIPGSAALSVLPYGRVIAGKGGMARAALVTASAADDAQLAAALGPLTGKGALAEAAGFALRLRAEGGAGALVEAAASGCGCEECGGGGARVPGALSVGLGTGRKWQWSEDVAAWLHPKVSIVGKPAGPTFLGFHVFDCHSIWHWDDDWTRWTECSGPCPKGAPPCNCGQPSGYLRKCKGWVTCDCF